MKGETEEAAVLGVDVGVLIVMVVSKSKGEIETKRNEHETKFWQTDSFAKTNSPCQTKRLPFPRTHTTAHIPILINAIPSVRKERCCHVLEVSQKNRC